MSPEARWLAESSAAAGYVVIFLSALFGGFSGRCGHMVLHDHPNQGESIFCRWWRHTLLVLAHSLGGIGGGGGGGEKGSWCKL